MLLGKHKLLSDGQKAKGVVLETNAGATTRMSVLSWHVKVRAQFDDGTTGEFDATLHTHQNGVIPVHELVLTPEVGDIVPIRFDPKDHAKVLVDVPELHALRIEREAKEQQRSEAARSQTVADAESKLKKGEQK